MSCVIRHWCQLYYTQEIGFNYHGKVQYRYTFIGDRHTHIIVIHTHAPCQEWCFIIPLLTLRVDCNYKSIVCWWTWRKTHTHARTLTSIDFYYKAHASMLTLSLRSCSQSYFHNQRAATLLIKLACWQSVFTVCVNAPFWARLWMCSARSCWFSPLEANSFSWVSAVHSRPAVNIDFSVYCSQWVCVSVWLFCSPPEVHHRAEQADWPQREICVLTPGFIVILLNKLISRFFFQHFFFFSNTEKRREICFQTKSSVSAVSYH